MAKTFQYIKDFFVGTSSSFSRNNKVTPLEKDMLDSKTTAMPRLDKPDFFFIHQTQTSIKLSRANYLQKTHIDERKI